MATRHAVVTSQAVILVGRSGASSTAAPADYGKRVRRSAEAVEAYDLLIDDAAEFLRQQQGRRFRVADLLDALEDRPQVDENRRRQADHKCRKRATKILGPRTSWQRLTKIAFARGIRDGTIRCTCGAGHRAWAAAPATTSSSSRAAGLSAMERLILT
jgi:hypothetical protein